MNIVIGKTLDEKIENLLKEKRAKDELDYYLEKYKAINDFLNIKLSRKQRIKEQLAKKVGVTGETTYPIDMNKTLDASIQLHIEVECKDVLIALRDYYKSKIAEYIGGDAICESTNN